MNWQLYNESFSANCVLCVLISEHLRKNKQLVSGPPLSARQTITNQQLWNLCINEIHLE